MADFEANCDTQQATEDADLTCVFDGDTVLLHCPEATGYSEPTTASAGIRIRSHSLAPQPRSNLLTIFPSRDDIRHFSNSNFATFRITHGISLPFEGHHKHEIRTESGQADLSSPPMTIAYGSTIKLQHQATGKYLSVSEDKSAKAYLGDENSGAIFFQIINHDKGWGEDAVDNDCIKLESTYHVGYRVQCINDSLEASYHVELSASGSVFTIKSHCRKSAAQDPRFIKGGSVIMLSSAKTDGYISAKGSFVNSSLTDEFRQPQNNKVGLRRWRPGAFKLWPSSGDTFFQLEKKSLTGNPFKFGEECRVKHLPTQKYISVETTVDDSSQVILQDPEEANGSELFEILRPIGKTAHASAIEMYVHSADQIVLKHKKSQKLLSVNMKPDLQNSFFQLQDHFSQWFNLALEDHKTSASIYEVLQIEEDAILDIHFVTGVSSSLCGYYEKLNQMQQDSSLFKGIAVLLRSLENRFKDSTLYKKKRLANMLRILQTIDIMVATLKVIKEYIDSGYTNDDVKHACSSICTSLNYIEYGNLKSRRYLARKELLDTVMQAVGNGFGAEKVLIALCRDDMEMTILMQDIFVSWIVQLCPDESIQNAAEVESWNPEIAELVTTLAFNGRRFNTIIQGEVFRKTCDVGSVHHHHVGPEIKELMEIFLANYRSMEKSSTAADRLSYVYNSDLNFEHSQFESFSDEIKRMTGMLRHFLSSNERHTLTVGDDHFKGNNSIIAQVLGILIFFIDYGIYTENDERKNVIQILIKILDGSSDTDARGRQLSNNNRYSSTFTGNELVFKIKTLVLLSLQLFLRRLCNISMETLLMDFGHLRKPPQETSTRPLPTHLRVARRNKADLESVVIQHDTIQYRRRIHTWNVPPPIMNQLMPPRERPTALNVDDDSMAPFDGGTTDKAKLIAQNDGDVKGKPNDKEKIIISTMDPKLSEEACARLRYNFNFHCFPEFNIDTDDRTLRNILLDLINYEDDDIRLLSTELLFDIHSVEKTLLSDAKKVYLTTSGLNQAAQDMIKIATMTDDDQLLSLLFQRDQKDQSFTDEVTTKITTKLTELSKSCVSVVDGCIEDDTEPIASVQGIAYSCGLFDVILEFVLDYGMSLHFSNKDILSSFLTLLQQITRKNPRAQLKLFDCFRELIEVKTAIVPMTYLLNEVFCNNSALCSKLSEANIEQIFFAAISSSNPEHCELTVTLRTILENMKPATHLQEYVAQLIRDNWRDYLGHILGPDSSEHRVELLQDKNECPELHLLLNISDLLSSCAAGKNQFAESVSEDLFEFNELLGIITNEDIVMHRKLPFIRILISTYLDTERDSTLPCSQLADSKEFWLLLREQSSIIKDLLKLLSTNKLLGIRFKALCERCWSNSQWMAYSSDLNGESTNTSGQLLYVMEGILPLLSFFCLRITLHLSGENEACTAVQGSIEIDIVKDLYKTLVQRPFELTIILIQKKRMKQWISNIALLCESLNERIIDAPQLDNANTAEQSNLDVETMINQNLQDYIVNLSQAYDGNHSRGSKSLMIPKGPSFAKLIELFTDTDEDLKTKNKDTLKVTKLVSILRTVIQKQRHQGLCSVEKASVERVTLMTLQIFCGLFSERIAEVQLIPRDSRKFWQHYNETIQPLQKLLLDSGVAELLIDLVHHHKDDIAFQVLACFHVLLYPGNKEAQKKITSHINQQSRNLFLRVHQILRSAQANLNRARALATSDKIIHEKDKFVDHRITMALKVNTWLCDGQQRDMQDALRDSRTFGSSNIVSQVSFVLHGIVKNDIEDNIDVVQSAVQALIEMCAGNYKNQQIAFKCQVIFSIDRILQDSRPFCELKSSSIELLEIMLEETDKNSFVLTQWIINCLDVSHILCAMFHLWQGRSEKFHVCRAMFHLWQGNTEKLRNGMFRAFHVLRRIADFNKRTVDELVEYDKHSKGKTKFDRLFSKDEYELKDAKRMWQECQHWSRSVEIVYKAKGGEEILTRACFPYDPHKHLNEVDKDHIQLHIKRNTPQAKLYDLLQWTDAVRAAHTWKKEKKEHYVFKGMLWASPFRHFILFWLTIILNCFVLFGLRIPSNYNMPDNETCTSNYSCNSSTSLYFRPIYHPETPVWYHLIIYILGSLHLILALWMVLYYFLKHWINLRFDIVFLNNILYDTSKGLLRRRYIYWVLHKVNQVLCFGRIHSPQSQPEKYFQIFFLSFEPLYRVLFVCFSILGLVTNGYFYCFCMIYLFLRNRVLLYILRALRKSILQLVTVFVLGLVVIYIYAVVSFALVPNYFNQTRDQFCETVFQCFITITRFGLLDTLGTAISIRPSLDYKPSFHLLGLRTLYDIIFLVVVSTLGLNIVIAILVDRFSDLRERQDKIDADNESRCFICSIKKDVFERYGDFRKHYQEEHNIWNYVDYALYLDTVHPNDHNALEKYVWEQLPSKENRGGSIDFFPMFKAKALSGFVIPELQECHVISEAKQVVTDEDDE